MHNNHEELHRPNTSTDYITFSILCTDLSAQSTSRSQLFHGLNPLNVKGFTQPRIVRCSTWLLFILLCVIFLAATKQLYKWYFPSVCPSVRLSVTPFWLCSHHRIIMKFSRVNTNGQRKVHAKGQGQRSKVKVTEVTTQLNRFRTVTPVWINIWWWNDAYSLMLLRRGALLFFKVIRQISRSHGSKNRRIWPRLGVSGL